VQGEKKGRKYVSGDDLPSHSGGNDSERRQGIQYAEQNNVGAGNDTKNSFREGTQTNIIFQGKEKSKGRMDRGETADANGCVEEMSEDRKGSCPFVGRGSEKEPCGRRELKGHKWLANRREEN